MERRTRDILIGVIVVLSVVLLGVLAFVQAANDAGLEASPTPSVPETDPSEPAPSPAGEPEPSPEPPPAPPPAPAPAPRTPEPASGCDAVAIPPSAVNRTELQGAGDFDGDGAADGLYSYRAGDDWHLQVQLAAGGGDDIVVDAGQMPGPLAEGAGPVNDDARDEIWARIGSGASVDISALYVLDGCELKVATIDGVPASFLGGGSVTHLHGVDCGPVAGAPEGTDLTVYTGTSVDGETYETEAEHYALEGRVLSLLAAVDVGDVGQDMLGNFFGWGCER